MLESLTVKPFQSVSLHFHCESQVPLCSPQWWVVAYGLTEAPCCVQRLIWWYESRWVGCRCGSPADMRLVGLDVAASVNEPAVYTLIQTAVWLQLFCLLRHIENSAVDETFYNWSPSAPQPTSVCSSSSGVSHSGPCAPHGVLICSSPGMRLRMLFICLYAICVTALLFISSGLLCPLQMFISFLVIEF